jgi:hypothetical protein
MFIENGENQFISKDTFNNGDFDYRLHIHIYTKEYDCADFPKKFMGILQVGKTVKYTKKKNLQSIQQSFCTQEVDDSMVVEAGYQATIVAMHSNSIQYIKKQFTKKSKVVNMLFGFYMDKPQNRVGNTGWDFLDGKLF